MKYKLQWNSEEEGILVFLEEEIPWLCFDIFILGEEAELVIKCGEMVDKAEQLEKICGKLLEKAEKCIKKAFSLLWKKGIRIILASDWFSKSVSNRNAEEIQSSLILARSSD